MSVDVDAVNERLNGLVTLLKAVGVDGEAAEGMAGKADGGPALDMARQLNDDQIEAIIKKLQQAQTEAPQIIAALEAHAEAKTLTEGAAVSSNSTKEEVVEEVVEEQVEEEEEDDEFDEDANYPMVGHGVSDDISVVSDLTTPTVVTNLQVPEEEHYRETLPPMVVGGVGEPSMVIAAPKRKNLVSQVRPPPVGVLAPPGSRRNVAAAGAGYAAPAGGAAAARRKMYQDTMAKLHENPNGMGYVGPAAAPANSKSSKNSLSGASTGGATPKASSSSMGGMSKTTSQAVASEPVAPAPSKAKTKKTTKSSKTKEAAPSSAEWSFEEPVKATKKGSTGPANPTVIDDDGFLVGDSFDPFSSGSNPFKSSAGDLEFGASAGKFLMSDSSAPGGFGNFGGDPSTESKSTTAKPRKSKSKKSGEHSERKSSSSSKAGGGTAGAGAPAGEKPRRRARRMSAV